MSIQAWRTSGKGTLEQVTEALAPLGANDVRFRVRAISLNFRDKVVVRGGWERPPAEGRIPFTDAVGIVTEVGAAVSRFNVGDRVCTTVMPRWIDGPLTKEGFLGSPGTRTCDGVLASHLQWHEDTLVHAPTHLDDAEASTLTIAALTAWHAVVELGVVGVGDTVVVQTTGSVATFAIQFAVALGARVIVVSRSSEKLQAAMRLGAHAVIDSTQTPDWDSEVLRLTGGDGAQLILDMGLQDGLTRSTAAAAIEGTVAIIGVVQTMQNSMAIFPVMNGNLRLRGVETGSRAMFERMNRFLEGHHLHPVIGGIYPVSDVERAMTALDASPFGKIVLMMPSA